jgi:hypothetical protein
MASKCKECSSPQVGPMASGGWTYRCGSFKTVTGQFQQTLACSQLATSVRIATLTAEVERLRSLLAEAHEAVSNWGAYADEYFKEKWNLQGDIDKFAPFKKYYPKEPTHER